MNAAIKNIFDTQLSPEKVKSMSLGELNNFLIENNIVYSYDDVKMLIIEGAQKALNDDDEFPIRYYTPEEPLPETSKVIENQGEMLTDALVDSMK